MQPKNVIDENDPKVCKFGHPAPPWLVNYADLMTEMVCFFIILYALSSVLSRPIQEAKREIERIIKEEQLKAEVKFTKEGIRLTLEEEGSNSYFGVGRAELTEKMTHLMTKLGPVFRKMPNEILIEGHTDDRPINTPEFPSNWELSSARALAVLHHLIDTYEIDPRRISAIGYGEFRPRAPSNNEENRSRNRRVVFFIKNVPPKLELKDYSNGKNGVPVPSPEATTTDRIKEEPVSHAVASPQTAPAPTTVQNPATPAASAPVSAPQTK